MAYKFTIAFVFIVLLAPFVSAQNSSFYAGFKTGIYFASKKSASLYDGTASHGIEQIYDRQNIQTQITEELKYPYTLQQAPLNPTYNPTISIGGTLGIIIEEGSSIFLSMCLHYLE